MHELILDKFKLCIPKLSPMLHKGQAGKIGVIGGSREYSGAPFFAAMTSMRVGADISHIFCTHEVAPSIRSYSPDLIVHSTLDKPFEITKPWISSLHALIIGPGLGRDKDIFENTLKIITEARNQKKLLVFDADGLYLLSQNPGLLRDYELAVLTPNAVELRKLKEVAGIDKESDEEALSQLSTFYGGCTILAKGKDDLIFGNGKFLTNSHHGSFRRVGGQGDLLSGCVGVFGFWALDAASKSDIGLDYSPLVTACNAASTLVRECSQRTFKLHSRSMTTSDMLHNIPSTYKKLFESDNDDV